MKIKSVTLTSKRTIVLMLFLFIAFDGSISNSAVFIKSERLYNLINETAILVILWINKPGTY